MNGNSRVAGLLSPLVVVLAVSSGCGGGGSPAGIGGKEQTVQFGPLTMRAVGQLQPAVVSGGSGTVITGLAGAAFGNVEYTNTTHSLAQTPIAFVGTGLRDDIFVMRSDGNGDPVNLTDHPKVDKDPAISPDGKRIAFASYRDGPANIYVMDIDGSNVVKLTESDFDNVDPCWSPDGTYVAYTSFRDGHAEVYRSNISGQGHLRITHTSNGGSWSPSYSPDGTRLVIVSSRDSTPNLGFQDLYTIDADGGNAERLTTDGDGYPKDSPAWSSDGTTIAFERIRISGADRQIATIDTHGNSLTILSGGDSLDQHPRWSPDSSKIAFTNGFQVFTMDRDGSNRKQITGQNGGHSPTWGPLVRPITFIGTGGKLGATASGFLFGQDRKELTSFVAFNAITPADVRVQSLTGVASGNSNYVFEVRSSDALTSLNYINSDIYQPPTTVLGVVGNFVYTARGAIVSFGSESGEVTSVLPYTGSRSAGSEPVTSIRQAGATVCRAKFLGVWDAKGKNLAPHGASEVRIDAVTGKLLGFH